MKKLLFFLFAIVLGFSAIQVKAQSSGNALSFDGVDDYIQLPLVTYQQYNVTMEAWVKWAGPTAQIQSILYNGNSGPDGYGIYVGTDSVLCALFGGITFKSTYTKLPVNVWVHLALVSDDNSNWSLYLNGQNILPPFNIWPGSPGTNTLIGGNASGLENFNGKIDEVRIWNTARSISEIRDNMNKTLTGSESELIAYYKFNQGSAGNNNTGITTLIDNTTNALNGTLINFALNGNTSNWVESFAVIEPILKSTNNFINGGFTANWYPVEGATDYTVDLSTDNTFTNFVPGYQNADAGNNTFFSFSGLPSDTFYYRVRSFSGKLSENSILKMQMLLTPIHGIRTVGTGGDYADFVEAFDSLNTYGLDGNIILQVISDITEPVNAQPTLNPVLNYSGSYSVTIVPSGGNWTVEGDVSDDGLFVLNGINNLIIDGDGNGGTNRNLTFINNEDNQNSIFEFNDSASNIIIKNCILKNLDYTNFENYVAYFSGNTNNLLFQNNQLSKTNYGFYINGANNHNLSILNNLFGGDGADSIGYSGLTAYYTDSILIKGNEYKNFRFISYSNNVPINELYYCSYVTAENNNIHDNIYTGEGGWGVWGFYFESDENTTHILVRNNVIRHLAADSWPSWDVPAAFFMYNSGSTTNNNLFEFYNNSVYLNRDTVWGMINHGATPLVSCGLYIYGDFSNIKFKNNLIRNSLGNRAGDNSDTYGYAFYLESTSINPFSEISNNVYYTTDHTYNYVAYDGSSNDDMSDWETFSGETNSFYGDPMYVNDTNLYLQSCSPAIFRGTPISGITSDFEGTTRNTLNPTIGAYEYIPTQANNVIFSNVTDSSFTMKWTNGNLCKRAVFIKKTTSGSPVPEINTTYNADSSFTDGAQIQTSGWYCVYNGNDTMVTVGNLAAATTYRIKVVEYFGDAGSEIYYIPDTTLNPVNITTDKLPQTITFNSFGTVTYGDPDFAPSASASSNLSVTYSSSDANVATIVSGNIHITGAGTCIIYADQPGDTLYNAAPQQSQILTVDKAMLTVTANNTSKCMGATNPSFTFSYSGFVYNEDQSVLTTNPTGTCYADELSSAGNYEISCSGAQADNYYFTYISGILSIIPLPSVNVTVTGSTQLCQGNTVQFTSYSPSLSRFATNIVGYSTQYDSFEWSANQLLGVPDTYPSYGDIETAWTSDVEGNPREYLELGYNNPAPINYIDIFETYNPGYVDTVYVMNPTSGLYEIVYQATAGYAGDTARKLHITFPTTTFDVSQIRIAINTGIIMDWVEIDAVGIGNDAVDNNTYLWSPNGETTANISAANAGDYYVVVSNVYGCSINSDTTVVTTLNTTSDTTVAACESYTWNGVTYMTSGDKTYTTTNVAGCDSVATLHLTVNHFEGAGTDSLANVCSNLTSTVNLFSYLGGTYSLNGIWLDDNNTGMLTGSTFNASNVAQGAVYHFTYVVTNTAPCVNDTAAISLYVDICGNVNSSSEPNISIYPNPVKDMLYIDNAENRTIEIYNSLGQKLQVVDNKDVNAKVDLSAYKSGYYMVKIISEKKVIVTKITVQ